MEGRGASAEESCSRQTGAAEATEAGLPKLCGAPARPSYTRGLDTMLVGLTVALGVLILCWSSSFLHLIPSFEMGMSALGQRCLGSCNLRLEFLQGFITKSLPLGSEEILGLNF